nr:uncharacterized protein LOC109769723 [Aegilops tauschii subsp. strangulata]
MCLRDRDVWLMRCPLICNWAVEVHLPHRVYHQFGLFQPHPLEWVDTDKALHRLDRRKQQKIKDRDKHHASYVTRFHLSVEQACNSARAQLHEHSSLAFDNYLQWFLENARVEICPLAYNDHILEDLANFEDLSKHKYNKNVRERGYELDDDMTLADAQVWSAYMLKPRQPILQYTPTDFDNGGNPKVVVGSSQMASLDDEAKEEVEEEEARPGRRKKMATRHGTRNTRGRH